MAKAAVVVGAAGIMVEVHPDPVRALCDGPQSLDPTGFDHLMRELLAIRQLTAPPSRHAPRS
jgi:3-deoxy-7-phosphoheptulonate synthase